MDILSVPFETAFTLQVNGEHIKVLTFKTPEHGNIKFGIEAPRSVKVNREEVYLALRQQEQNEET